jgi:hypothetical protein
VTGSCECGNEPSGSIKCGEFLDKLRLLLFHWFIYLLHKQNRKVETVSPKYRFALRYIVKKGKAVPLKAWTGPEGSRKLRFPDFVTTAQDGGKVISLTHRPPSPPRKCSWYSFLLEDESTS